MKTINGVLKEGSSAETKECQRCFISFRNADGFERLNWLLMQNCSCLNGIKFPLEDGSAPDGQIILKGHELNQDQSRSLHDFIEFSRLVEMQVCLQRALHLPDCEIIITRKGGIIKHLTLTEGSVLSCYQGLPEEDKKAFQDWVEELEKEGLQ